MHQLLDFERLPEPLGNWHTLSKLGNAEIHTKGGFTNYVCIFCHFLTWSQATLPVAKGGLGLRPASEVAFTPHQGLSSPYYLIALEAKNAKIMNQL